MAPTDHFVQFYESDVSLIKSVSGFVGAGLDANETCLVIATADHLHRLEHELTTLGIDLTTERACGRYMPIDASATLEGFMVDGSPQPHRFRESVGTLVAQAAAEGRTIRAFGEMVALLWSDGNHAGAIELERLWNELAQSHAFCLFCAYSMDGFSSAAHAHSFGRICAHHTSVIPAESYSGLASPQDRLREITLLQQQARSLEAEIARRKEVERVLSKRERELSDFFENALEGLHKVGPDGTILWANRAELNLLGYRPDEYVGHHVAEFHADRHVIDDMLARLQDGESLYDYPARLRCKDGTLKHVLIHSNAHFEDGVFLYSRCFTRDVTDRTVMESALREHVTEIEGLNEQLRRSVTETHHRVKNNLQLVSALIDMQKQTGRETIPMSEVVRLGQNIQALGVIHDILTMQSRQNGGSEFVSADEVLERLLPLLRSTLGSRMLHASLASITLPPKQATALAIITNELVSNAVKHAQGNVELALRVEGPEVTLEVSDDGTGFPEAFDPEMAAHTGLELVENVARYDLAGTASFRNREAGGACVLVTFALPQVADKSAS